MKKYAVLVLATLFLVFPLLASAHGGHRGHRTGSSHQAVSSHPMPTPPASPIVPTGNEVSMTAYLTSYQSGDNDPAGSIETYINGLSGTAGGSGTYANPITLAVGYQGSKADYAAGTLFYVVSLQKYFIAGDTCASCHQGNGGHVRLDMYSGNFSSKAGLACEDAITGDYQVIVNPVSTLPVNTQPLFDGKTCIM